MINMKFAAAVPHPLGVSEFVPWIFLFDEALNRKRQMHKLIQPMRSMFIREIGPMNRESM